MMRKKDAMVAFAKDPYETPVKTRLAATIGNETARMLYIAMLEDCLGELCSEHGRDVYVACYPDRERRFFTSLQKAYPVELIDQEGADLGERMYSCASRLLISYSSVFLFGTDLPVLPMQSISTALANDSWDIAFGPAQDGGFYAIGLRKCRPEIFQGVNWSSSTTLVETITNCVRLGLETIFLDLSFDVDDRPSLDALSLELSLLEKGASKTRRILSEFTLDRKEP